jgi:hypothetical protein
LSSGSRDDLHWQAEGEYEKMTDDKGFVRSEAVEDVKIRAGAVEGHPKHRLFWLGWDVPAPRVQLLLRSGVRS